MELPPRGVSSSRIAQGGPEAWGSSPLPASRQDFPSQSHTSLLFKKKKNYLFIWLCRVLVAACGIFSCGMQTLSCGMWDPAPRPGIEPGPPVLGARILSHWTTREVPSLLF